MRRLNRSPMGYRQQQGFVLILGMVFLVILTLVAVANMRIGMMEERMTGGFNDRNSLAFESAELALRDGEAYLNSMVVGPFNSSLPGLHAVIANGDVAGFWNGSGCSASSFNWNGAGGCSYREASTQLEKTAAKARYVIEDYADAVVIGGSQRAGQPKQASKVYRITARGVGGQASTVVILQTTYKR